MSPTKTIPRPIVAPSMNPPVPAEERGVMRGVSWNFYDRLTDAINERSSIRVAFDGKDVEIMVVGPVHEGLGGRLGVFISEVCDGLDLDSYGLGSATLKREDVGRGEIRDAANLETGRPGEGPRGAKAAGRTLIESKTTYRWQISRWPGARRGDLSLVTGSV